jgi:hypothetical protein
VDPQSIALSRPSDNLNTRTQSILSRHSVDTQSILVDPLSILHRSSVSSELNAPRVFDNNNGVLLPSPLSPNFNVVPVFAHFFGLCVSFSCGFSTQMNCELIANAVRFPIQSGQNAFRSSTLKSGGGGEGKTLLNNLSNSLADLVSDKLYMRGEFLDHSGGHQWPRKIHEEIVFTELIPLQA